MRSKQQAEDAEAQGLGMALRTENMDPNLDPRVRNGTHVYNSDLRRIVGATYAGQIEEQVAASREAHVNHDIFEKQRTIDELARTEADVNRQLSPAESDLPGDSPVGSPRPPPPAPAMDPALVRPEYPIGAPQGRVLPDERSWETQYVDTYQGRQNHTLRE